MKTLFLALMLLTPSAFADLNSQFKALMKTASEQCQVPEHLNPTSERMYFRFISQVFIPEAKMLNTAFVTGFSTHMSKYQPIANCLVVFLGRPNDPAWEKNFSFYQRAKSMQSLPEMVFAGFDEDGNVLLEKTPEGGVN